jgi:hypothetical protein
MPGAAELFAACRSAGIKICLAGFSPATRDAIISALGWDDLIDLAISPADAGRGRPRPDLPLTALLRLGGGSVAELAVAGDTPSDVESGLRAGAGLVAGVLTGDSGREELAAVPDRAAGVAAHPGVDRGPASQPRHLKGCPGLVDAQADLDQVRLGRSAARLAHDRIAARASRLALPMRCCCGVHDPQ